MRIDKGLIDRIFSKPWGCFFIRPVVDYGVKVYYSSLTCKPRLTPWTLPKSCLEKHCWAWNNNIERKKRDNIFASNLLGNPQFSHLLPTRQGRTTRRNKKPHEPFLEKVARCNRLVTSVGIIRDAVVLFRGHRPTGWARWAQGRHTDKWPVALSMPRGQNLSGTMSPSPAYNWGFCVGSQW